MKLFISENKEKYKTSAEFAAICLAEYSGLDSVGFIIYKDEYGKPWCNAPDGMQYYFSVSHSKNVITCVTDRYNIGIDCQFINKDYRSCLKIAGRFFHIEERKILSLISSDDLYVDLFFEIWAKKEAYVKFTGRGILDGLTNFNSMDKEYACNFLIIPYKKEVKLIVYSENLDVDDLNGKENKFYV